MKKQIPFTPKNPFFLFTFFPNIVSRLGILSLALAAALSSLACFSLASRQAREFLGRENEKYEAFRVFISRGDYIVKQVQHEEQIRRTEDKNGDREKKQFFQKEHDKINFRDLALEGTLLVELNASGQPVNIQYVRGKTPRTWQASKHFIQDIARFRFTFPNREKRLYSFRVRYFWSIAAPVSLSSSTRKKRAIKYLRSQRKE